MCMNPADFTCVQWNSRWLLLSCQLWPEPMNTLSPEHLNGDSFPIITNAYLDEVEWNVSVWVVRGQRSLWLPLFLDPRQDFMGFHWLLIDPAMKFRRHPLSMFCLILLPNKSTYRGSSRDTFPISIELIASADDSWTMWPNVPSVTVYSNKTR